VGLEKLLNRIPAQERHIPAENQDGSLKSRQNLNRSLHGMSRAQLFFLIHKRQIGGAKSPAYGIPLKAGYDDQFLRAKPSGQIQRIGKQGNSGQGMEDFDHRGLHPGPFTRRQNDDRQRIHSFASFLAPRPVQIPFPSIKFDDRARSHQTAGCVFIIEEPGA
jgi:hypothetical protein